MGHLRLFVLFAFVTLQDVKAGARYYDISGVESVTLQCEEGNILIENAYNNCFNNDLVQDVFEEKCNGRETCTVRAEELVDENGDPCDYPAEIGGSFKCGFEMTCDSCTGPVEYFLRSGFYYQISSDSVCGGPSCPLEFTVDLGHGFAIMVVDETWDEDSFTVHPDGITEQLQSCAFDITCVRPGTTQGASICGGSREVFEVYDFIDLVEKISVEWNKNETLSPEFTFYIEAESYRIPEIPVGGWVFRLEDSLLYAGCYYTRQLWEQDSGWSEWDPPLYQCPQYICPDGSDVEAADSDSCDSGFIPLYEKNDLIGCCQENTQIAYCEDGSAPIEATPSDCPSGFFRESVRFEQKCCPLYALRPECPFGRSSVPMVDDACESGTEMIYSQKNQRIWAGCCVPESSFRKMLKYLSLA